MTDVRYKRTIVRKMRTGKNKSSIDWLLPPARSKLLGVLLGEPAQRFYLRELTRKTDLALGTVRRELAGLAESGIILRFQQGNRTYYQANAENPIFPELSGLIQKTAGMVPLLQQALEPVRDQIEIAFLYGSEADGRAVSSSDVDVLLVGRISFTEIVKTFGELQDSLNREINPTVYPVEEFQEKIQSQQHFITSVLKNPKIFLIGNERDLTKLAE